MGQGMNKSSAPKKTHSLSPAKRRKLSAPEESMPPCKKCKKNEICPKFKGTSIKLCEKCYLKKKQIMYEQDIQFKGTIEIDEITSNVYLGNNEGAKSKEELHKLGITHILVVGFFLHEYYPDEFKYKTIEIEDNEESKILKVIIPAIEFIDRAQKVYVHCRAGVSRSSSIVIAYLMLVNKLDYEHARDIVKEKRNKIEPNPSFEKQLREFGDILVCCNYKFRLVKEFFKTFMKDE